VTDPAAVVTSPAKEEPAAQGSEPASAPVVTTAPTTTPAPAAAPAPAGLSVRSARCSGRRCTLTVRVSGDVERLRAVLRRGKTTVASATRAAPTGTLTLRVTAKRTLRTGTYRLKTTVTGKDGKSKSSTRTIKIRRR
jgi:hypothetical protein